MVHHDSLPPAVDDGAMRWELHDLPPVMPEPAAPPLSAVVPRLAVGFGPDAPDHPAAATAFQSWEQVSAWLASLADPQAKLDDALRRRATELTAGQPDPLGRIRAVGEFVQGVNYVSIQTGVGRGGGYRPHAASRVLQTGYGDCKDKANLMRALLAALDVPSWLVSIHYGDPDYVRDDWPSPQQFNHCIIAIRAPAGDTLATHLEHPELGSLMLFDPTDPLTPFGDLPESEQGSLALLIGADRGSLVRVPEAPLAANVLHRTVEARIPDAGGIEVRFHEMSLGTQARAERSYRYQTTEAEYRRLIERWVTRGVAGAAVQEVVPQDGRTDGRFDLDVAFTAARFGQKVSDAMRAICPVLVSRREALAFTEPTSRPVRRQAQRAARPDR